MWRVLGLGLSLVACIVVAGLWVGQALGCTFYLLRFEVYGSSPHFPGNPTSMCDIGVNSYLHFKIVSLVYSLKQKPLKSLCCKKLYIYLFSMCRQTCPLLHLQFLLYLPPDDLCLGSLFPLKQIYACTSNSLSNKPART